MGGLCCLGLYWFFGCCGFLFLFFRVFCCVLRVVVVRFVVWCFLGEEYFLFGFCVFV